MQPSVVIVGGGLVGAAAAWGRTGEGWTNGWAPLQAVHRKAVAEGAAIVLAEASSLCLQGSRVTGVQDRASLRHAADRAQEDDGAAPSLDMIDHAQFDQALWPAPAHRVPGLEALRLRSAWAGFYDMIHFDHNALIGAWPELDGLVLAWVDVSPRSPARVLARRTDVGAAADLSGVPTLARRPREEPGGHGLGLTLV